MKKYFTLFLLLLSFSLLNAQTAVDALQVKHMDYNFGNIPQGKPVYYSFEFTNNSGKPLKIDNVQTSCGCTTPEWNREEIASGVTDKIRVGYNSATEGPFDKIITITYNGTETKQLRITGNVWKAPVGSAPANASINFLKKQMQ